MKSGFSQLSVIPCRNISKIQEILLLGFPTGLMMGLEIGMFTVITLMMGCFGIAALAAHQVAIQYANLVFTFPLGISQAIAIQIGLAMGAKHYSLIRPLTYTAITIGILVSLGIALIFLVLPSATTKLFIQT